MKVLPCSTNVIQFSGEPSVWYNINLITGTSTTMGTLSPANDVNAIGFNLYDNLLYGYDQTANKVVIIDADRIITDLGIPVGQIPEADYQVGTVSNDGYYYLYLANDTRFYTVDVNPGRPTYKKLVDPTSGYVEDTAPYGTSISTGMEILDWAYNQTDKCLYGVETATGYLKQLNPITAVITTKTFSTLISDSFGSVVIDGSGILYAIGSLGKIYRYLINSTPVEWQYFVDTPRVNKNDATICPTATITLDFGDAPDRGEAPRPTSYRTKLASNGPRHGRIDSLILGDNITTEVESNDNMIDAKGDDIRAGIQDDGVEITDIQASDTQYKVKVKVYNSTGSTANVYGWVDFNRNGAFDVSESAFTTVSSSTTNPQYVELVFNIPKGTPPGKTFARVRLTTDNLQSLSSVGEDTRSFGPASNGEVEDYDVQIVAKPPVCPGPISKTIMINTSANGTIDAVDPQGYALTYKIKPGSEPSHGTVTVDPNTGAWTYTPNTGFTGDDSFIVVSTAETSGLSCTTTVNIKVVDISLSVLLSVNKPFAKQFDELVYTLEVTNTSDIKIDECFIKDILDPGTSLIPDTTFINGVLQPGADPTVGISIEPMAAGEKVIINFAAKITAPVGSLLTNVANATATVTVDGTVITKTQKSNIVYTSVVDMTLELARDKAIVLQGDTIEYTINYINKTGNTLKSVILYGQVPPDTALVANSTYVNGVLDPTANIVTGINIGELSPGETLNVKYKVRVDSTAPDGEILTNKASLAFKVDTSSGVYNGIIFSNEVSSTVLKANVALKIIKSATPTQVAVGDIIKYTLTVSNNGTLDANDVILTDPLAPELEYDDTLTIDGVSVVGDIRLGVNIGTVAAGKTVIVTFNAKVISEPMNKLIKNITKGAYTYKLPSGTIMKGEVESNTNYVEVVNVQVAMTKTSSQSVVEVNDTFYYTIKLENTGSIDINECVLVDKLPIQLQVLEILVDDLIVSGDLNTGISLDGLAVGQIKLVKIKIKVIGEYTGLQPFKNEAIANCSYTINGVILTKTVKAVDTIGIIWVKPKLRLEKSSDLSVAVKGDIITYTIVATNEGNIDFTDVVIKDILAPGIDFIEGSVKVNSVSKPTANIMAGVDIGPLSVSSQVKVEFKAVVVDEVGTVTNVSVADYYFKKNPNGQLEYRMQMSNKNVIIIEKSSLIVGKTADKEEVSLNDIITYTVQITNISNSVIRSVLFKDELDSGVQLLENSVTVDGIQVVNPNLLLGINVGNIAPGKTVIVKYKVIVIAGSANCTITNRAYAEYKYVLSDGTVRSKKSNIATVEICNHISSFKQLSLDQLCVIPSQKPDLAEINEVTTNTEVKSYYLLKTPVAVSNEGQILSGYKLVVNGYIRIVIEYTSTTEDGAIHSYSTKVPFATFIVLPSKAEVNIENINVDVKIEDIDYAIVNCREIFVNLMYIVVARLC